MIEVEGVSKYYGRVCALDRVSLRVEEGQILLLLGSNGAGKSTLVRSILGIISYRGSIRVAGLDPLRHGKAVRQLVGYMPQTGGLHQGLTVGETLGFYASLRRVCTERGDGLLAEVGLDDTHDLEVGELSGGMRQRLGFAIAVLGDPPILVLDEPTASLDARSREILSTRLRAFADDGKTVLLSTHAEHQLVHVADRAIALEEGAVVADATVGELRTRGRIHLPTGLRVIDRESADGVTGDLDRHREEERTG